MVHQATGLAIWSVHRTQKTPRLWQQLAHCSGSHFEKISTSVYAAEMGEVADKVQLVCHHAQTGALQHAETCRKREKEKGNKNESGIRSLVLMISSNLSVICQYSTVFTYTSKICQSVRTSDSTE